MTTDRRNSFDVSWRAIAKVLAAVALVWIWLQLWQFIMVIVLSIVMAIALDPAVRWLERARFSRSAGAAQHLRASFPIVGAMLALPIAAIYPTIERIWLRDRLGSDTVDVHKRLSA